MKKKKRKNRLAILGSIFALSIIVLFISSYTANSPPKQMTSYQTQFPVNDRWYHSSILKFSILVPAEYTIEDTQITVTLHNKKGDIIVSRVANSFSNLNDYLVYLSIKNKLNLVNKKQITINNFSAINSTINYPNTKLLNKNIYFIYVEGFVYSLSTSTPSLFSDLDTIVHSFQYIP